MPRLSYINVQRKRKKKFESWDLTKEEKICIYKEKKNDSYKKTEWLKRSYRKQPKTDKEKKNEVHNIENWTEVNIDNSYLFSIKESI